jgi:hypothetical protein
MPATTAICKYQVDAVAATLADVSAKFTAIPLDQDFLDALGLSVISDVVVQIAAIRFERTITLSLLKPPFLNFNPRVPASGKAQVSSSSPEDDFAGGAGAQLVQFLFFDPSGAGPFAAVVSLKGTTPVEFPAAGGVIATIDKNFTILAAGPKLANVGRLEVITVPINPPNEPETFPIGSVPASFYSLFFTFGFLDPSYLRRWMLLKLQAGMIGFPVTAVEPVFV